MVVPGAARGIPRRYPIGTPLPLAGAVQAQLRLLHLQLLLRLPLLRTRRLDHALAQALCEALQHAEAALGDGRRQAQHRRLRRRLPHRLGAPCYRQRCCVTGVGVRQLVSQPQPPRCAQGCHEPSKHEAGVGHVAARHQGANAHLGSHRDGRR
jgi:hypothetical protein